MQYAIQTNVKKHRVLRIAHCCRLLMAALTAAQCALCAPTNHSCICFTALVDTVQEWDTAGREDSCSVTRITWKQSD